MSDQERELTPEQEAAVRRLLGEARATEPVPTEVAARLDRVLEGLDEERGGQPPPRHVVAPASRRRRASVVLVAAAAVVAIGVGLGQLDGPQSSDDSGGDAADPQSSAERAPQEDSLRGGLTDSTEDEADGAGSAFEGEAPTSATPVGRIRSVSFTADASRLRRALPAQSADGEFIRLSGARLPQGYVLTGRAFDCASASWGRGVLVPVFFDGTPAVLAYRPVLGESQVVELLQCGTGDDLRSTTLPAD